MHMNNAQAISLDYLLRQYGDDIVTSQAGDWLKVELPIGPHVILTNGSVVKANEDE